MRQFELIASLVLACGACACFAADNGGTEPEDAGNGGAETAIARDGTPNWSPDSSRIVFYSERDGNGEIYVMNADGSNPQRLTDHPADEGYPSFAPDGSKILFDTDRDGDFEIYAMNADGSDPQRLTNDRGRDLSAAWSPDGTKIAFMSDRNNPEGSFDIWLMNPDGSEPTRITELGSTWFPQWSPDGAKLAFHVGRDVHLLELESGELTRLTVDPANGMYPSFSPDGSQIVFMSWRTGRTRIWLMDADGANQHAISAGSAGNAIDPRWSPDGSRIVFAYTDAGFEGGGSQIIYTMRPDGSDVRKLTGS